MINKKNKKALKIANAITCTKELYNLGLISTAEYKKALVMFLDESGYTFGSIEENQKEEED